MRNEHAFGLARCAPFDLVEHLAVVELGHDEGLGLAGELPDTRGEGVKVADAFLSSDVGAFFLN